MNITKVIIPAAGLGSRFLPYTKAVPKEMIPLLNKPAMQYVVEESVQAGIKNIIIVNNRERLAIHHYFSAAPELTMLLKEQHKEELIASVEKLLRIATFTYISQAEPLGLGHAVLMASHMVDPREHVWP